MQKNAWEKHLRIGDTGKKYKNNFNFELDI